MSTARRRADRAHKSPRQRQRERRERERNGWDQLKVTGSIDDLAVALINVGALDPHDRGNRAAVERALSEHLRDWSGAWADVTA